MGAYDQRKVETRGDVLVYTSEPLAADLEVTGWVSCQLFAATTGEDADWTAKLVDVVDIPSRRRGKVDESNGTVLLRLREPGDEEHDIYSVYFSREAENQKVQNLAKYLGTLAKKYYNEKPLL